MTASHPDEQRSQIVQGRFDDIDALADAALDWDQEYHQIGRGRFHGELTQVVLGQVQLAEQRDDAVLEGKAHAGQVLRRVRAVPVMGDLDACDEHFLLRLGACLRVQHRAGLSPECGHLAEKLRKLHVFGDSRAAGLEAARPVPKLRRKARTGACRIAGADKSGA